jgi:hypothetical protein
VVTHEIGDSWIHGSASDPVKTSRFLALQRLYGALAAERLDARRLAFGRGLAMVAEHTCGVDVKSYLRDESAWDRAAFERQRHADPRFAFSEASWSEQRAYLDAAVAALDPADRVRAEAALREGAADAPEAPGRWKVTFDAESGDIATIRTPAGLTIAGAVGTLMGYRYESYDASDVQRHLDSYLTERPEWAILDHGKPGLEHAQTARSQAYATCLQNGVRVVDDDAHRVLGAPGRVDFSFRALDEQALEITLVLRDKPANRMPEAGFLTFTPAGEGQWELQKMGFWHSPSNTAGRAGAQLQSVTAVRRGPLELRPLDTPLACPIDSPFMRFAPSPPSYAAGVRFNLHNNKWGTNFPQWWGTERFAARFVLKVGA